MCQQYATNQLLSTPVGGGRQHPEDGYLVLYSLELYIFGTQAVCLIHPFKGLNIESPIAIN